MNYLDLFHGIGGFALGAYWADMKFENHYCSDIEPYCQELYAKRFPDSIQLGDITKIDTESIKLHSCLDDIVKQWYGVPKYFDFWEKKMAGKLKKLTSGQALESVKMYESGMSLQEVADYYSVSRQAMWDLLRRRTEMRSQKKYGKENVFYRGKTKASDKSQNILEQAIKKGVVERKTHCEACGDSGSFKDGRTKVQAHHTDYNKPLDVLWLCQKCHHEWHKNNRAIEKEERPGTPGEFIISGGFP